MRNTAMQTQDCNIKTDFFANEKSAIKAARQKRFECCYVTVSPQICNCETERKGYFWTSPTGDYGRIIVCEVCAKV